MYNVVYEDKYLIGIDKLCVVPTIRLGQSAGLSDELILEFPMLAKIQDFGITHRLDNETLGIIIVAKDQTTYTKLRDLFNNKKIYKTYHARVCGHMKGNAGVIDTPIAHDSKSDKKMLAVKDGYRIYRGKARPALTHWTLLSSNPGTSDLELVANTGVRHQIRVHLASIGHCICGDVLYGKTGFDHPSLMLISKKLVFIHP